MARISEIEWLDDFIGNPKRATDEQIEAVELILGVQLPQDFVAIAREHQGQTPFPCRVSLADGASGFGSLLHFNLDAEHREESLAYYSASPGLYESIPEAVPICYDAGGNYFAFDYGQDKRYPPVVFWDHETGAVQVVSRNFTDLLEMLTDEY